MLLSNYRSVSRLLRNIPPHIYPTDSFRYLNPVQFAKTPNKVRPLHYSTTMTSKVRSSFELKDWNYVVTGGAQGIGLALTKAIAEMGGNVAVLDLQRKPSDYFAELAKEFRVKIPYFQADVADTTSLEAAFQGAVDTLGHVDGLVTSAGIALEKPFTETTAEEVNKILQVNVS